MAQDALKKVEFKPSDVTPTKKAESTPAPKNIKKPVSSHKDGPASPSGGPTPPQRGEPTTSKGLVKDMPKNSKPKMVTNIVISLIVVAAGIATGFGLSKIKATSSGLSSLKSAQDITAEGLKLGDIVGSADEAFRDKVEGVIVAGGIDGEGSHHLLRPGGVSQNVYLTSSVLDLDQFIDHKVNIWGETFAAQKAGWLMDVGRVEVLELNAEKPFEEEKE